MQGKGRLSTTPQRIASGYSAGPAPPFLAEAEERALFAAWRTGDARAGDRIVLAHLPLAGKMARKTQRGWSVPGGGVDEDLFSEAVAGMFRAARTFDPGRGFRFSTYAMHWIRSALQDGARRSRVPVVLPHGRNPHTVARALERLSRGGSRDVSLDGPGGGELARSLGMDIEEARALVRAAQAVFVPLDGGGGNGGMADLLVDGSDDPEDVARRAEEERQVRAWLERSLETLSPREVRVIRDRRLREEPLTLAEIGEREGVSRERIRQIEGEAMACLLRLAAEQASAA